jgi:DnaK suppressor protein
METQVKRRLEQELALALAEFDQLDKRLESKADYGLGKGDPHIYEWELNFALRQKTEGKIRSIKSALQKIEQGTYGWCERCGETIDPERLKILPHTSLCVQCARSMDERVG